MTEIEDHPLSEVTSDETPDTSWRGDKAHQAHYALCGAEYKAPPQCYKKRFLGVPSWDSIPHAQRQADQTLDDFVTTV